MVQQNRTVLIVDDFSPDRETYRRYLLGDCDFNYIVLDAETGEEGLALCQRYEIDGILLDFWLPDIDGLEFIEQLKAQNSHFPPIIMVTAYRNEAVIVKAIKSGAEDFLVKDITTAEEIRLSISNAIKNTELQRKLKASEERFRISVENMLDCFGIYSAIRDDVGQIVDFRIDYLNATALANNRMTKTDIGKGLCELLPSHYHSGLFAEYCRVVETGEALVKEDLIYRDSFAGEELTRAYDLRVNKLEDSLVISWRDITDKKKVEIALQRSQERFQGLAANVPGVIYQYILRPDGSDAVTYISPKCREIYELEPEELLQDFSLVWSMIHPDDVETVSIANKIASQHLEEFNVEFRIIPPSGRVKWIQARSYPQLQSDGAVIFDGLVMDITQRKQSEASLKQSEAIFRGLFESNLIGIIFWNLEGKITDANKTFLQMTGYSREEIQAGCISYEKITPPEYHQLDAEKFQALLRGENYTPFEKEYICKDGRRIPILLGCAFMPGYDDQGVAFVLDISEQKHLQQEQEKMLVQTQAAREEAEAANRSKDEFIAVVSHELRSPLNSILGWAKLLQTRKFDAASTSRALETIERNARSQSQLIEDLLDISRMVRGNLRLHLAPVNLNNVIIAAVDMVNPAAQAKQIEIQSRLDSTVSKVSGDFNRLQQIFVNLLTNAIKFTPNHGQVTIELYSESVNLLDSSTPMAIIRVIDNGIGISSDFLPYVFERFRQARDTTRRAKDGLGLGLAIVHNLVELHGGTITVDSQGEGMGATFTVRLPQISSRIDNTQAPEIPPTSLAGIKILVIDDDEDSREFVRFVLNNYQATVETLSDVLEAVAMVNKFQPDIIISDISMPQEDGHSFLTKLRQQEKQQGKNQTPAIALTALASEANRNQSLNVGFQRHFVKPIEPTQLVTAITTLITTK